MAHIHWYNSLDANVHGAIPSTAVRLAAKAHSRAAQISSGCVTLKPMQQGCNAHGVIV